MTEEQIKARNRLVTAGLRLAAAERGGADSRGTEEELEHASILFDLAARMYIEVIGPRVLDEES